MKINIENEIYPKELRKIKNPPKTLNLIGNIELLKTNGIAVIGSRNCSKYGERMAKKFVEDLTCYNLTIISGMAKGIDYIAHESCLNLNGKTIAVLPSGLNKIYPEENKLIFHRIIKQGGLVVSEYDENTQADSNKFLERNRIISGLSIGILVVEGGYRSGTSVTAKIGEEQGKKIFCVPSSLENRKGITPNNLIKNGAQLVTSAEDIIEKYEKLNLIKIEKKREIFVEPEYQEIFNILNTIEKIHINELTKKLKTNIKDISSKLMMLELNGKIEELPGNYYKRI